MSAKSVQLQLTRGGLFMTLMLCGLFWTGTAMAEAAHERVLATRILENLEHGQPVRLQDNQHEFLALYHPVYGSRLRSAVLLVHGMGSHPDWPEVIQPLRIRLPGRGLSTLSLQMPVLPVSTPADEYGVTMPEAIRRIAAGVKFLRSRDYASVFIIGYSFGAATALNYLAEQPDVDVEGLVTISILAREYLQPPLDLTVLFSRVDLPVLDIYGGRDFPEVIRLAQDRRQAARSGGNSEFRQAVVEGADHYYTGQEEMLVKIITDWLSRFPARLDMPATTEVERK
jgi:pimeloyl-ACP methyl ester carboxylesterase